MWLGPFVSAVFTAEAQNDIPFDRVLPLVYNAHRS